MLHLQQIRSSDENWSGLKDAKARRKLQNRLNVRAHRQRKLQATQRYKHAPHFDPTYAAISCYNLPPSPNDDLPVQVAKQDPRVTMTHYLPPSPEEEFSTPLSQHDAHPARLWNPIWKSRYVWRFLHPTNLPLSSDHLIPLIQYNLLRGCLTNMSILDLTSTIPAECHEIWGRLPLFPSPTEFPESLIATPLQKATPHPPWVDMLPDPTMRDNALRNLGRIDEDTLMVNLCGGMCRGENNLQRTGVLVWKNPWLPEGWELTQGFVDKYWFLARGCSRMIAAANRYRDARGEEPLVIELE